MEDKQKSHKKLTPAKEEKVEKLKLKSKIKWTTLIMIKNKLAAIISYLEHRINKRMKEECNANHKITSLNDKKIKKIFTIVR